MLKFSSWNPFLEKFPKASSVLFSTEDAFYFFHPVRNSQIPLSQVMHMMLLHLFYPHVDIYSENESICTPICPLIHIIHRLKKRSVQIANSSLAIVSILPYLNQPRFTNQATMLPPRTNINSSTAPYPNFHCSSGI